MGWAKNLAKPGGMISGIFYNTQAPKKLELLKELRPQATRFGYLMNGSNPATPYLRKNNIDGARTIGIELEVIELKELSELAAAFDRLRSLGVEGVAINADPVFISNPAPIAELALAYKLPSVGDDRSFAKAGCLFTLSPDYVAIAPYIPHSQNAILGSTTKSCKGYFVGSYTADDVDSSSRICACTGVSGLANCWMNCSPSYSVCLL